MVLTLRTADAVSRPASYALFDQLRRATISIEANIVEGYALSTRPQFLRHLRIAVGSAAEAECLLDIAAELEYLPADMINRMKGLLDEALATLFGLLRRA